MKYLKNILSFHDLFIIIITILNITNASNNNQNNLADDVRFERIVDYVSSPYQQVKNLTCIPHDTTFTCDCLHSDMHMNLAPLSGHIYQISIRNCPSLEVSSNLLINTQALRTVTFENVDNLVLRADSLLFPASTSNMPLILKFHQVQIEKICSNAINGNIQEISFTNGSIGTIQPFAITTRSEANILKFESMLIDRIESMAFKKFAIDKLEIINTVITSNLPSKSFYELKIIDHLIIRNVTFAEIHTNAFLLDETSKLIIQNNQFDAVNGEWLCTSIKSNVLIENNNFNLTSTLAFKGIKQHKDYKQSEKIELRFINNQIRIINDPLPLEFHTKFHLIIQNLYINNQFPCSWKIKNFHFYQTYADVIYLQSRQQSQIYLKLPEIMKKECETSVPILAYIIGSSIGIFILLIIIGLTIWYWLVKRNQNHEKTMKVIVPESRTYRETQIVYQIENAGLLKTDL